MARREFYVSIDIEANGPAPGLHSMLALGAAAFAAGGEEIGTWYSTLRPVTGLAADPATMAWWATQPEAWAEVTRDPALPADVMPGFTHWVRGMPGKPIAVAWPAAYDFAWVNYYCHRYAGANPLGFACCDIRSYANGLCGYDSYYGLSEDEVRAMAGEIDKTGLRPHVAVDDAIEQGRLFMALLAFAQKR